MHPGQREGMPMPRLVFPLIAVALVLGVTGMSLAQQGEPPATDNPKTGADGQKAKKDSRKERAAERAKKRAEERREARNKARATKRAERRASRKGRQAE